MKRITAMRNLVCVLVAAICGCGSEPGPRPTRIILITLDTLRLDSFAGNETRPSAMPKTLAFARTGRIFESFFSATPTTQPSHASLLTGLHPWEHGVTKNGQVLGDARTTVAEVLRSHGFSTAAVVASFPLHQRFGFAQGFDTYEDHFSTDIVGRQWAGRPLGDQHFYSLSKRVTDQAIAQIERAQGPRQFFWFHYFDSHEPYGDTGDQVVPIADVLALVGKRSPEMPALLARAREAYDRDNTYLDDELDRLFQRLKRDSARFETHIVLTADHGEGFGESKVYGHGKYVTPELIRVPLFIVSPRVEPGVDRTATGSIDVAATMVALAEIDERFGNGRGLAGRSPMVPATRVVGMATPPPQRRSAPGTAGKRRRGPRFFASHDGKMITGNAEKLSPNLNDPEVEREIRNLFAGFESAVYGVPSSELTDPETRAALEALGYVE